MRLHFVFKFYRCHLPVHAQVELDLLAKEKRSRKRFPKGKSRWKCQHGLQKPFRCRWRRSNGCSDALHQMCRRMDFLEPPSLLLVLLCRKLVQVLESFSHASRHLQEVVGRHVRNQRSCASQLPYTPTRSSTRHGCVRHKERRRRIPLLLHPCFVGLDRQRTFSAFLGEVLNVRTGLAFGSRLLQTRRYLQRTSMSWSPGKYTVALMTVRWSMSTV